MEYGLLNVGELSGVKIIQKLKENTKKSNLVIIDSPPGTSCSTVAAIEDVDYAIIVTEPTPFGVSDMKMVLEMLREMNIPFGVFVNKADLGDNEVYVFVNRMDYLKNIADNKGGYDATMTWLKSKGITNLNDDAQYYEAVKLILANPDKGAQPQGGKTPEGTKPNSLNATKRKGK